MARFLLTNAFLAALLALGVCARGEERVASDAAKSADSDTANSDTTKSNLAASLATRSLVHFAPIELSPREKIRIALLTAFWMSWFFFLGAALGSYLNVVVYRMPLRMNTISPVSRCPKCQTAIRPRDNIPVISWLLLRGKCRVCGTPISSRYITVEVLMGALFLGLLCVEVLSGGANLPLRPQHVSHRLPMLEHFLELDLVGIYFYHAALLWLLVGLLLFQIDGWKVQSAFTVIGLSIALLPSLIWPTLHPVAFMNPRPEHVAAAEIFAGVSDCSLGLVMGLLVGLMLSFGEVAVPEARTRWNAAPSVWPGMMVGAFLGHQAVVSVGMLTAWLWLVLTLLSQVLPKLRRWPMGTCILIATLLQLVFWPRLITIPNWPGTEGFLRNQYLPFLLMLGVALPSFFSGWLRRQWVLSSRRASFAAKQATDSEA